MGGRGKGRGGFDVGREREKVRWICCGREREGVRWV